MNCLVITGRGGRWAVPDLSRRTRGVGALMYGWGQSFNWAALAVAWLLTFAIGIAIYFLPVTRLLDSLTE